MNYHRKAKQVNRILLMYNKILRTVPVAIPTANLTKNLAELHRWTLVNNVLTRKVKFKDYETTWAFLTKVSMRSHLWGHHPTITTTYNKVKLELSTHDLQGRVSDIDFEMAKKYEKYLEGYDQK